MAVVVTTVRVLHGAVLTWFPAVVVLTWFSVNVVVTTVRVLHSVVLTWFSVVGVVTTVRMVQCCTDLVYYGCCRDTVRVLHSVVLTWFITAVVVTPYECYTVLY